MRRRLAALGPRVVELAQRVATFCRQRAVVFGEAWRTSLQFRVTVSTLALSSAVVFVLGMVLQNQITDRLLDTKQRAAVAQTRAVVGIGERELASIDADPNALEDKLKNALKTITSSSVASQDLGASAAGAFEPVLAAGGPDRPTEDTIHAGPYQHVPPPLRKFVEAGQTAWQIHTVGPEHARDTYLIVGAPVNTIRPVQLYLLFPLSTEQNTVTTVQNTLLVGGLVLLLLLAGITNLVTRQVVRPVRQAAAAAERFAGGDLDQRLTVLGEDDLSKLAVSYNEMAASIQRQIRQLEEFGQLQRRFTSDVSHELRTPLTTVRMAADVLHASREQFPAGLARSTELLVDELDRFEALLGDLLEISRLDAGVEELAAEVIDVRPVAERAVEQVRVIAGTAGSTIEVELPDEQVTAEVDARRVERILRNLLANAVDHSEGEPVRLVVAANDTAVAMAVRDYGVGLRQGEAELVFNRFWRADPSRNRRTGGTGLGLAISHEDARLHGGMLEAWGEPDRGACFRLTLPCRQGEPIGESPVGLPPDPPPPAPEGPGRWVEPETPVGPGAPEPQVEHEEVG
ncbi:two-component system, OmpR family, sensor histidine kinase MtrB [Amycolatopsis arida]|uniref:Sensor histidine kinase MtrB n=1 Tax=Amycolatopsis arida TaxID=587909 RepID=A0A1I5PJ35_9PSEU|nr:MtrAB system histidine kinase MtrB [Amycolatopsis arida]TDX98520.1 two-component system sensor histidine kinase MtrB [Amycolatopsis arida]SFP34132.1 two-component system, OmpR family, sensor histidine kinase MtrB [Amycolatopsis arida]